MSVLARICDEKRIEVGRRKAGRPLDSLLDAARNAYPPRGFAEALQVSSAQGKYGVIAEIKKASPSKGLIRADFEPAALARAYKSGGAACLSVLTDEPYFQGADEHLIDARAAVDLPVLRKDFILDPYQVIRSRAIGADCILLILAAIDDPLASELAAAASEYGMDVLVEVHNREEMDRALRLDAPVIGINNRNLKTLDVDLSTTEILAPLAPKEKLIVCESGLSAADDLALMARIGVRCFLIGESLMRQDDVAKALRLLLTPPDKAEN